MGAGRKHKKSKYDLESHLAFGLNRIMEVSRNLSKQCEFKVLMSECTKGFDISNPVIR